MSFTSRLLVVALLAGTTFLGGCGNEADSPEEAVRNYTEALFEGDEELYMASVHYGGADKEELARLQFQVMSGAFALVRDIAEEYGEESIGSTNFPTSADEALEDLKIETRDGKKVASVGDNDPMPLIEQDGAWKVDISGQLPGQGQAQQMRNALKAHKQLRGAIGK